MIGDKIRNLRVKQNLTQKELADKVFVTAQAVSKWEKNEAEPSIKTINQLAQLFNVDVNYLISENDVEEEVATKPEVVDQKKEQEKFNSDYIDDFDRKLHMFHRILSFVIGGLLLALGIAVTIDGFKTVSASQGWFNLFLAIGLFTFSSCVCLRNNFLASFSKGIRRVSFFQSPGVIFEFSLEGLFNLIFIKGMLFLIKLALFGVLYIILLIVGLPISIILYPFAIIKNFRGGEEIY